jgi:Fe2+ transport system protein FeoA/Mn-dependent DtxR family transcriptional regulator
MIYPRKGVLYVWRQHAYSDRVDLEDALKRLYELGAARSPVSLKDLADASTIPLSKAQILTNRLVSKHWVDKRIGNGIQLTGNGERKALQIIRAHRVWESYLAKEGTAIEDLHEAADKREHSTTPSKIREMESDLGHPKRDPHGDVIPTPIGEISVEQGVPLAKWPLDREARVVHVEDEPRELFTQLVAMGLTSGARLRIVKQEPNRILVHSQHLQHMLAPETAERIFVLEAPPETVPLSELLTGEHGIVEEIDESGKSMRRLLDIGVVPGSKIEVMRSAPLGDPVEFRIKDASISLRRHEANKIWVRKSDAATSA